MTLAKTLWEKMESQMTLTQEFPLALQQLEWEKEEREMSQSLKYHKSWYPYTLLTEEERAREILEILRPHITRAIKDSDELPTTMANCFRRALHVKHFLTQIQEEQAKAIKVRNQHGKRKNNPSTLRITQF